MKILYLGQAFGTSQHRADALTRLEHNVKLVDPHAFLPQNSWIYRWQWQAGGLFLGEYVRQKVLATIGTEKFDLVVVNGGALITSTLIQDLKKRTAAVVNYNNDDPFGGRDRNLWRLYFQAVPYYDLLAVVRETNVGEAYAKGAKKVIRVFMSADEVAHRPRPLTDNDYSQRATDILFIGTWMPERGPLMAALMEAGLPLTIYGDRWQKAKEWTLLKSAWKGTSLWNGDDYAKAIQTAKISLGLLSKGNRDLHTQRSMEIPLLGGLFCAERTPEHLQLYRENEEAVFWSDAAECVRVCQTLLKDEERRKKIAVAGRERCLQNQHLNESVMSKIIAHI